MMSRILVPAREAEASFTEKRSTFLGHVWPVSTEEEARSCVEATKKRHRDARHNCWCYVLRAGPVRCSDDGEPQGTAGQPILGVFQKEGVSDACCVVTRYFGGVLLGAGGLARAYTRAARDALNAAGVTALTPWTEMRVVCPYSFLERVRRLCADLGGSPGEIEYTEAVNIRVFLPEGKAEAFAEGVTGMSAGAFGAEKTGETLRPA